jgi:hypothetical protein
MRTLKTCFWRTLAVAALGATPSLARAQVAGVFTGVVTRDTLGHAISGAAVALPALNRAMQTNASGEFRFAEVPAGMYLVTVRAIGFAPFADSIAIKPGQTLDGDLSLTLATQVLDTLITKADRSTVESRSLAEFDTRRKANIFGAFVSDSTLRANETSKLSSLIGVLAGARMIHGKATDVFLAAGHDVSMGGPAFLSRPGPCFATIYIDARLDWSAAQPHAPDETPPNLGNMRASDYAGIEFYATPAAAPAEFSSTGSSCGVLLLWTRKDRVSGKP